LCCLATARLSCTGDVCSVNSEINNLRVLCKQKLQQVALKNWRFYFTV